MHASKTLLAASELNATLLLKHTPRLPRRLTATLTFCMELFMQMALDIYPG